MFFFSHISFFYIDFNNQLFFFFHFLITSLPGFFFLVVVVDYREKKYEIDKKNLKRRRKKNVKLHFTHTNKQTNKQKQDQKSEIERKLLAYKNFFLSIFFLSSYQLSHFCHFFFSFPFFWIWIWIQTWNLFFIFLLPCKLKFKFFEGRERERTAEKMHDSLICQFLCSVVGTFWEKCFHNFLQNKKREKFFEKNPLSPRQLICHAYFFLLLHTVNNNKWNFAKEYSVNSHRTKFYLRKNIQMEILFFVRSFIKWW